MSFLRNRTNALVTGTKAMAAPSGAMLPTSGPGRFIEIGGQVTWISDKLSAYVKDGYQANDIVYSAVMMVMDKVRVAPWNIYKVVDESSLKKYHALMNSKADFVDWSEVRLLRNKALEPVTKYDPRLQKLADLLKWANEYSTFNDLVADAVGYKMITGNNYMWANTIPGGSNEGIPQELYNLPAQYMSIIATYGWPPRITGYQLNNGFFKQFTSDEVMHTKYFNPDYSANGDGLYGMSPLKPGSKTITRSNAAKKAGATQLDNNGAAGIAYVDDPVVPAHGREAQAGIMKRAWGNEYSGADRYGKVAFSGYKMGYLSVGMSLKDMDVSNVEVTDLRGIFNLWGLPSQLGNDPNNKTYNSLKEAEKALTTRGAIPQLTSVRDSLNKKLGGVWGNFKGYIADFDSDAFPELQENQKEKWDWVDKLPVSSKYKLQMMNLEVPDDPNLDVILIEGNRVPLADVVNNMSDAEMQAINDQLNKSGLNDYHLKAM